MSESIPKIELNPDKYSGLSIEESRAIQKMYVEKFRKLNTQKS